MTYSLWKFLNTDIKDLFSLDTVSEAADATGTVMKLAKTLEDKEIQEIAPWIEQGASLLDVLNTPEAELVESLLPFAKIATGLLKVYLIKSKKNFTFSECVILVAINAYSESLRGFLRNAEKEVSKQSKVAASVLADIEKFTLPEDKAKKTLLCFHRSSLAEHLSTLMRERLQTAGFSNEKASRLSNRATWNTHRYLTKAWNELPDEKLKFNVNSLAEWKTEQRKYDSIDTYLKEYISPNPTDPTRKSRWQVFDEPFTFKEIYVPLKVQPLTRNGDHDKTKRQIDLESWVKLLLDDPDRQNQVLFVQAGPGRGKSVFCRVFANAIRHQFFPIWIPILIRLRDIIRLQNSLEETLRNTIWADFVRSDTGWLTDNNTRFLFFLDGFDELLMEGRTSGGLELFLRQIGQFQRDCTSPEMGHRVIVTGRTLALQNVERTLPNNLERVEILPMGDGEKRQWLNRWSALAGQEKANQFLDFLEDKKCPPRLKGSINETGLAQEPLLLYLLAAMHRDNELNLDTFANADGIKAKILIYQKSLKWVLTKQRSEQFNLELTELQADALYRILTEAGLCVIQSGGECASITMIEKRLRNDNEANELLEAAQERLKENPLRNALAVFYLQPGSKGEGSVEFAHKSFSEFLCAERIKQVIEDWTNIIEKKHRSKFEISDDTLHREIYDLLGTPVLTEEIVEYLFELLHSSDQFQPLILFSRLQSFYLQWCKKDFINQSLEENFPQQKMLQLQKLNVSTGMQLVDIYAGLNVLIILFKLHAAAQHIDYPNLPNGASPAALSFHPCQDLDNDEDNRLLNIIYYADSLDLGTFSKIVGPHLIRANLSRANLTRANFESANIKSANLARANLEGANLYSANLASANLYSANLASAFLYSANLSRANLSSTNLTNANLTNANLESANLIRANLTRANLTGVNLASANLASANLSDISWDATVDWTNVAGLKTAINIPKKLQQNLRKLRLLGPKSKSPNYSDTVK
ncbi:NACHT domain-containing protein [Leptothoe spongobia]|uniref:Pentapeptide repeat-containing protein n=1 Tax=Leptothoe spongobia TAU-MAC 1115 TaxID=1967444 RepID=A0A947GMG0_9CYAN|nr:pentapeptide repeat-containing protein [Leptothoe spongobia]MBT9317998.1 pentapeptide repeat-containing protein [Leptothoe spongobia TAU-MAC 1115]